MHTNPQGKYMNLFGFSGIVLPFTNLLLLPNYYLCHGGLVALSSRLYLLTKFYFITVDIACKEIPAMSSKSFWNLLRGTGVSYG